MADESKTPALLTWPIAMDRFLTARVDRRMERDATPYEMRDWWLLVLSVLLLIAGIMAESFWYTSSGWKGAFSISGRVLLATFAGAGVMTSITRKLIYRRGWSDGRREHDSSPLGWARDFDQLQ